MNEMSCHQTYKEQLRPTPTQEQALDDVLWRCRTLDNTTLEQRITAWGRCQISLSRSEQEAELKDIRAEFPAYAGMHSTCCKTSCKTCWHASTRRIKPSSAASSAASRPASPASRAGPV